MGFVLAIIKKKYNFEKKRVMKKFIYTLFIAVSGFVAQAQTTPKTDPGKEVKNQSVEISCGECNFKLEGKSCDLAVRIDGKAYFVDGKKIDDFGDAHGKFGFCNAVRTADVTGVIINNRFKAKEIKLQPVKEN